MLLDAIPLACYLVFVICAPLGWRRHAVGRKRYAPSHQRRPESSVAAVALPRLAARTQAQSAALRQKARRRPSGFMAAHHLGRAQGHYLAIRERKQREAFGQNVWYGPTIQALAQNPGLLRRCAERRASQAA